MKLIDYAESSLSLQTEASLQPYFGIRSKDFKIATNIGKVSPKTFCKAKNFLGTRFPGSTTICTSDSQTGRQPDEKAGRRLASRKVGMWVTSSFYE